MKTQVNTGGVKSLQRANVRKFWHLGLAVPADTSGEWLMLLIEEMWLGLSIYTVPWLV